MDIEARLRSLESRYRKTLSGAISAKAHYLALLDEPSASTAEIKRARDRWQALDDYKREIAARMGELEDAELRIHL